MVRNRCEFCKFSKKHKSDTILCIKQENPKAYFNKKQPKYMEMPISKHLCCSKFKNKKIETGRQKMKVCENCKLLKDAVENYERLYKEKCEELAKLKNDDNFVCKKCGDTATLHSYCDGAGYFYKCVCEKDAVTICPTVKEAAIDWDKRNTGHNGI